MKTTVCEALAQLFQQRGRPLDVCEEELLALYQDKLQDVEHQIVVLTALHARLAERIACLERQLRTQ